MTARVMAAALVVCATVGSIAAPERALAQGTGQVDAIWPGRDVEKLPGRARIVANDTPPLERRVTLTLKDVTLDVALQELSMRTGVRLIYSARVVPVAKRVSIELEGATVQEALARLLAGVNVEAKADGERILLVRREAESAAMDRAPRVAGTVGGRVRDAASGRALAYVAVSIIDSTFSGSMYTNDSGIFVIPNVPAGEHVIKARLIGFKPAEQAIVVNDRRLLEVNFELEISGSRLQEVVSTATGHRRKLEIGSDITVIDAATIVREQPVASVTDLLEGRVPGMMIQRTSGAPGDPARIRLRGVGSPNLSNDPIIIVDGIRVYSQQSGSRGNNLAALTAGDNKQTDEYTAPSPLDYIDPNSIETIEVIKGPSAATLYGQDAANGVIVVTTKKGRPGPARWTMSVERGMTEMVDDYPELMMRWGHPVADDQRVFCPITNRTTGANLGSAICVADTTIYFQMLNDPELTVLDEGNRTAATVGVSGGTDALTYNVTGSYQDEVGLVRLPEFARERYRSSEGRDVPDWMDRPQGLTRWGATSRLVARLGSAADVSLSANLSRTEQQRSELEQQLGSLMTTYLDRETGIYWTQSGSGGNGMSQVGETLEDYHERASAAATEFTNGASLNWRPLSWLTTTADAGLNVVQRADEILLPYGFGTGAELQGRLRTASGNSVTSTVNVRALATVPVKGGFRFQFATGVNYTGESVEDMGANIRGLADGTESPHDDAEVSFVRRNADQATFGWYIEPQISHRRFWLSTGLRLDGGNTFGTRVKLPAFPKLSFSYLLSDEPFFPWKELVPVLRLRIAYGHAGRQPGPVDRLRLYGTANPVWVDGQLVDGVLLESIGNTQLEPERTAELEGGFDADLLDDRLTLSLTGYRKKTRDALMSVPVPPSVYGADVKMLKNIGTVLNEGLEASIGAEIVRTDPVTWNLQLSLTQQRNEVVELGHGVEPFYSSGSESSGQGTRVAAGYPLFGRWVRPMIGFADGNHDGRLEQHEVLYGDTLVFVGGTLPNYQANIHTTFRLMRGALAVSAGFMYDDGMTQYNQVGRRLAPFSRGWNDPDSPLSEQARMWDETGYTWVQTVNTLRFNSLAVTYNIPTRVVQRTGARAMSLSIQGTNLGIHTNYRGLDPNVTGQQIGNAVIDNGVLPRPRTWQLRVNATY